MEDDIGKFGTFVLCRPDKVEVYDAFLIAQDEHFFKVRLKDGKETNLNKKFVAKIEWREKPPWLPEVPAKEESDG